MNRHGFYIAVFHNDLEPTPGVGEIILCPPSTGIKIAKVTKSIEAAIQFRNDTSLDLIIGIESQ